MPNVVLLEKGGIENGAVWGIVPVPLGLGQSLARTGQTIPGRPVRDRVTAFEEKLFKHLLVTFPF